jgi:hypothetical protein
MNNVYVKDKSSDDGVKIRLITSFKKKNNDLNNKFSRILIVWEVI